MRFPTEGAVGTRLLKFSDRFTVYSIYLVDVKLGMIKLDINPHIRYKQDFSGAGEGLRIPKYFMDVICTCFLVSPSQKISSDLRDGRSVCLTLFYLVSHLVSARLSVNEYSSSDENLTLLIMK